MSEQINGFIWFRSEFVDRIDDLVSFPEIGNIIGRGGGRTVSKWSDSYAGFPEVVCASGTHTSAKKYVSKSEFAPWLLAHEERMLERDRAILRRLQQDIARVRERIAGEEENVRVAEGLVEKWINQK